MTADRLTGVAPQDSDDDGEDELPGGARTAGGVHGTAVVLCEVLRSPRREGMYLYVERSEGLARVPEGLLASFGPPQTALVFRLHAQRRLARVEAAAVLEALREQGYYLQMPPSIDDDREA